jgi:hypothetical protein
VGGPSAGDGPSTLIQASLINDSFKGISGVSSVNFSNISSEAVSGSIALERTSDFLRSGNLRFITWEQSAVAGRAVIALDRGTAEQMVQLFSREVADYLSALMAPVATGEKISRQEYLRLVTQVYGAAVSQEIDKAEIRVSINFPGRITLAEGGSFSGSTARFDLNLADLLVLEKNFIYEVRWTAYR